MNSTNKISRKIHNPKSHSPAVYIPCWLIQVSAKNLSHGAKLLYGRLSQWSNSRGDVYRSASQLSVELGVSARSIEDYTRELKECGLIGTIQPQAGGMNHFEFYDHPWMHESIHKNLCYDEYPPQNPVVPPTESCGTPPQNPVVINIKEIKQTNKEKETRTREEKESNFTYQDTLYSVDNEQNEFMEEKKTSDETFEYFWHLYPVKKQKEFARNIWWSQKCHLDAEKILIKLSEQIMKDAQFVDGFIPNPSKYLTEERWKDEIFNRTQKKNQENKKIQPAMSFTQRDWRK